MTKLTEAENRYRETKDSQNFYKDVIKEVQDNKLHFDEAKSVFTLVLGNDYNEDDFYSLVYTMISNTLGNAPSRPATTKDYEIDD